LTKRFGEERDDAVVYRGVDGVPHELSAGAGREEKLGCGFG
jgi:hypothetical protein